MRIEIFEGKRGDWFWHFRATNGKITADAEPFFSRGNAIRAAKAVVRGVCKEAGFGPVIFVEADNRKGITATYGWYTAEV